MAQPAKKTPPPTHWALQLGDATGQDSGDFWALGYSSEYNEAFAHLNPPTFESPTSAYTFLLHYQKRQLTQVHTHTDRLLCLWGTGAGKVYAAGFPRALFEVDAAGVKEHSLKGHAGAFASLWGTGEDHLFACGFIPPFLLYRRRGKWDPLALPAGAPDQLHEIVGFSERDVYIVGGEGTVLHFDGMHLTLLEKVTTRTLRSAARFDEQRICAGGIGGTLLYGNRGGFRLVPTGTDTDLVCLTHFQGQVVYPTPDGVYAFDGKKRPALLLDQPAEWVCGLGDGLLVRDGTAAWIYDGKTLASLDTIVQP
jgi:hypothetical protein